MRRREILAAFSAVILSAGCRSAPAVAEIPQARAVQIARTEIAFDPTSIDVRKSTSATRPVWRVEMRGRLPGQPPMLFETVIVEVDRFTGAVVSVMRP